MIKSDDLQQRIIEAIQERKGRSVSIVDLSAIESAAVPKFIIAQGTSPRQVAAIADNVRERLLEQDGTKPYNYDGYANSEWIIVDYGNVMVHVFMPEARQRYKLEELWSDAVIDQVADLD